MMKIFGDIAPPFFTNLLWNSSAYKASFSLSNVPGPQYACHMKGRKLNRLMFFVPPVGFLGIFVCILSYNGEIGLGISADTQVLSATDVQRVLGNFESEIEALLASVNQKNE
eukprot:TRINITY_DN1355_c0_g1_i2.p4 TRINITY_DN1355_c0_g1~~TRINITY_DN1355_c0_g1_i2.p4  ORF type:complete len:112 (-),score=27.66 TRINITY_DN1355_c0_g1_i2:789-1124(-)